MPLSPYAYVVTFEFAEQAPETVRGKLQAANPRQAVRRALEAAMREKPKLRWQSLVVVLDRYGLE